MLQIYIYGPTESGFLDLDPATSLDMESTADIFDEDLSTGEFSLPVDVPWTENNRKLTGFAERFKNQVKVSDFKCVVYDSYFPELTAARFSIIGKDGNFSASKGKFSATVTGTKGLFGTQIKNKYLSDLQLGGKISFDTDSRTFAEGLMKGSFPQYDYLTFVPVAIENFFDTGRPDYDGEFLARDTVNTVIAVGAGPDGWIFGRSTAADPTIAAEPGTGEYADYRTIPFIRTKFLLKKIFEENGYKVSGDFFDSSDYDDLATYNSFAIENYSPDHYDYNRSIYPNNHVPNILIIDYLKGLLSFFNMYPTFSGNDEVKIVFRKDMKRDKKIFSLNGYVSELYTSTSNTQDNSDGYTLQYNWDGDNYYSDRVKDLKDKTIVATVATVEFLDAVDPGRQLTIDDIAFVTAENLYYEVADATSSPVKWEPYAEALDDYVSGAGDRSVDIPISPLCTYIEMDEGLALYVRRNYVGTSMTGNYINNKGILVKSDCPNKIFFANRRYNSSGIKVPISYNHNRDVNNNLVNAFSLAWKGDTGMAVIFHQDWQNIQQNLETIKTSVIADRRILAGMAAATFLEINNCLFLLSKTEKTIPLTSPLDVELVVA